MVVTLVVDAVVFTVRANLLQILLIKRKYPPFKGYFALPGGIVKKNESLEQATIRELHEETGVKDIFLKRFDVYGDPGRDPRGRFVSAAYIALISSEQLELRATEDAESAHWLPVESMPKLAFDHETILADSLKHLQLEIQLTNIAFQILPRRFTLTELQTVYELVLGRELDKRNFRKRIKALGIIKETDETRRDGAHRPARLHEFTHRKYQPIKDKIHVFL